jgi:HK97 gp10 family phage protein
MAKVEGTDKLRRKLTKFPKAAKFEIERAMIKGAREMVSMAKRMAPVKTGALRDSIQWNFAEDSPAYASLKGRTGGKPSSPDDPAIVVTAGGAGTRKEGGVRYAHLVEFGAPPHIAGGMFEGAAHPGAAAQPFFYPSWRAVRKRVKSRISRAVNSAAKKVAAG